MNDIIRALCVENLRNSQAITCGLRLDVPNDVAQSAHPGLLERPSIEQHHGRLVLLVSPDARDGSITINQDALLYGTLLIAGERLNHQLGDGRRAYVHIARGSARVNDAVLESGDGVAMEDPGEVRLEGVSETEVLLFDLP